MPVVSRPVGVPLVVAAGVLAGTGGVLGSLLATATGLSPLAVAGYRLACGGGLLLVGARRLPRGGAAWRRVALTAVLAAQVQAGYFGAVALTSVGLATLVTVGAAPVLVAAAELLLGRPASRRTVVACGLAVLGLGLLVGCSGEGQVVAGAGSALLAAAGFAGMTLLGARPGPEPALAAVGPALTIGGAALLAVAAATDGIGFAPTGQSVGLLVAFAVLPTALVYALYFRGLTTAPPAVAAVVILLEPLTGAVLAAVLLGERLGVAGLTGAVLLVGAVVLAGTPPGAPTGGSLTAPPGAGSRSRGRGRRGTTRTGPPPRRRAG